MRTLTPDAMRRLHGAAIARPRGAFCGVLTGLVFAFALTGNWVGAATIYMFTPVTCLFDYAY